MYYEGWEVITHSLGYCLLYFSSSDLDIPVAFLTKTMVSYHLWPLWTSSVFVLSAGICSLKDNKENNKDPLISSLDNQPVTGGLPAASHFYVSP